MKDKSEVNLTKVLAFLRTVKGIRKCKGKFCRFLIGREVV